MIHAYQEIYLNKAQTTLGEVFDYALNDLCISVEDLESIIINSEIISRFEQGDPAIIAGKSGPEIIIDIFYQVKNEYVEITPKIKYTRSAEYWIGWILGYYQWYSDRKISEILEAVTYQELHSMYYTLHEADISKTVEILDEKLREHFKQTKLCTLRKLCGYSQSELSRETGVSLRSIQMYEQRQKNINKASVQTLYSICKVLGCNIDHLLEKHPY
ncbi:MAG: helix-turn-helix domain-containing protein [Erysipelotrichaceae bacterium]